MLDLTDEYLAAASLSNDVSQLFVQKRRCFCMQPLTLVPPSDTQFASNSAFSLQ